ncbi:chromate efflux transporter [Desertivirga xinjiangensis]|uniref:chromate efflux transporter n=1 Tax=Desertivirga xinjiangensis TaxID=539206 RepID=UPI00210C8F8A|nr:chromate efflux transporter [Pedobacter xinjiangensis]
MEHPAALQSGVQNKTQLVGLDYLFFTFFKIGLISFGGHMALVSVIQRIMVEKDKVLENEFILNSIGIASFLPGPLAVNVVGQTGYHLRKTSGAIVSTVAVILPAFLIIVGLAWLYFSQGQASTWKVGMTYVAGVVAAVILTSGITLFIKEVQGNQKKMLLFAAALLTLLLYSNYFATIAVLLGGAFAGVLLQVAPVSVKAVSAGSHHIEDCISKKKELRLIADRIFMLLLALNQVLFFSNLSRQVSPLNLRLITIFAGISLSLFGGGYVMIPIMEALFVKDLHWLSSREFVDAIAFSQATPGPILISAAFIGYKISGVLGALLATAAIFTPSVFLVIKVSSFIGRFRESNLLSNMLGGIKAVVVALILVSAYRIILPEKLGLILFATLLISFTLNFRYKVSPVYLVAGAILFGVLNYTIS